MPEDAGCLWAQLPQLWHCHHAPWVAGGTRLSLGSSRTSTNPTHVRRQMLPPYLGILEERWTAVILLGPRTALERPFTGWPFGERQERFLRLTHLLNSIVASAHTPEPQHHNRSVRHDTPWTYASPYHTSSNLPVQNVGLRSAKCDCNCRKWNATGGDYCFVKKLYQHRNAIFNSATV